MGIYDLTVYSIIDRNARLFHNKPAWIDAEDQRTHTFGQIKAAVDARAMGLQTAGLGKGHRIGIIGKNCLDYFLWVGAAAALGGIVVPINWRLSADEAAFNLDDTRPELVLAEHEDDAYLDAVQAKMAQSAPFFNLQTGHGPLADLPLPDASVTALSLPQTASDDGLVIIHTAAVGGRPRGALLSHGNLLCANLHLMQCFGTNADDVHLSLLPLFHVAGLGMALMSFHAGALNVNMRKFDAAEAVQLIPRHKISLMFDFAPILQSLLDQQARTNADIGSLRGIMGLDSPETIKRYQSLTGGTFFSLYGQTETSMLATMGRFDDCPGGAGRPLALADVCIMDETDQRVPQGQVGEIAVRGPMVFNGYWQLADETASTFRNGWHHTGDLGHLDATGHLWYDGRKPEKELIKPGGENVYPAEVEQVILQHPAVAEVIVFGVPDPKWKEGIKAVCTLKTGQSLTVKELIDFVGQRIARYKKPQYVQWIDRFPMTADGRIDRTKTKTLYGQQP
jgi:acyl-CoA synthetase (AMP-forming)/AMP-acid ligase II